MPIKREKRIENVSGTTTGRNIKKREIKLMSFSLLLLDGAPFCFNYRLNSLIGGLPLVLLTLFAK
jgi:hypothetical protein